MSWHPDLRQNADAKRSGCLTCHGIRKQTQKLDAGVGIGMIRGIRKFDKNLANKNTEVDDLQKDNNVSRCRMLFLAVKEETKKA